MEYADGLLEHSSVPYNADHFDQDANYNNPDAATGIVANYYSDNNTADLTIPSAGGFPFSRTLFRNDGTDRFSEQSGIGAIHKIGSNYTTKAYFVNPSQDELRWVFADEAPSPETVYKTITIDPNQVTTVEYTSKTGQRLATCLSKNPGLNPSLDTIPSPPGSTVNDTVSVYDVMGENCIYSTKSLAFAEPTTIVVNYYLNWNYADSYCLPYCPSCDYTLEVHVRHLDDPTQSSVNTYYIPPVSCGGQQDIFITDTIPLPPGDYLVEKRLYTNNIDPNTITSDNVLGNTYLNGHLDYLCTQLENDQAFQDLETAITLLETGDLPAAYTHMENTATSFTTDDYTYQTACCTLVIPHLACIEYDCPASNDPDFAQLRIMSIIKSITARRVFETFPKLKEELWGGEFWSDGKYIGTVGEATSEKVVRRYIRNQSMDKKESEQRIRQLKLFDI